MPLYEYECLPNKHRFEIRHGMMENPELSCPVCGSEVRKVIQPVGIVFKGSGFYATDSRKPAAAPKPATSSTSETKTESASPAEKKTETAVSGSKPAAGKTDAPTG